MEVIGKISSGIITLQMLPAVVSRPTSKMVFTSSKSDDDCKLAALNGMLKVNWR